jgi:putative Holliday junction resolvase
MPRYLGIDYGEKRIGLALSDPTLIIAQAYKTLHFVSLKDLLQKIGNLVEELNINKIILGLPLSMKGSDSQKTKEVRVFGEKLSKTLTIPVIYFDERLSTVRAHQILKELGKKPSKSRQKVDQLAAQQILQTYLDKERKHGDI